MMRSAQQALTKRIIVLICLTPLMTSARCLTSIPATIPAHCDRCERLTILLHKRLDQVIDQEQQTGHSRHERERLAGMHKQIRTDRAEIRYGATEKTVREIERRYRAGR